MAFPRNAQSGDLLVVDDNRVNRLLLGRALEQLGHAVAFAENGRHALEALRQRRVDLILLDIEMPEMDGYQVLEALAADPHLRDIPVVMMSSVEEVDSVARCIEMGAEDYLFKPVNPVLLKARVGASLDKKRLSDQQRELVRKFATAEVAEEVLTTGLALGGKPVEASVMFSDIRSFTSIAEALSRVDTFELLNSYYTLMFDAIGGHGGIVNQMLGDGLMAIFGAPLPHADHRQGAVRAALEMLDLVDGFNREQVLRGAVEIRIGIGIASGPVIAGFTGTRQRVTYTCVGDTVNLAAHLEAYTKIVGQPILIDETTRQGLGPEIRTEPHGPVQFKTQEPGRAGILSAAWRAATMSHGGSGGVAEQRVHASIWLRLDPSAGEQASGADHAAGRRSWDPSLSATSHRVWPHSRRDLARRGRALHAREPAGSFAGQGRGHRVRGRESLPGRVHRDRKQPRASALSRGPAPHHERRPVGAATRESVLRGGPEAHGDCFRRHGSRGDRSSLPRRG